MACPNSLSERDRPNSGRAAYLEQDIVEAPGLRGEHGREAEFALLDEEREVHGTRARVTSSPGFARAGVGSMTVCAERLTVDERLRDRIDGLGMGESTAMEREPCEGKSKSKRDPYSSFDTTAVLATLTSTTWSRPTRLNEFKRARPP